MAHIPNDYRDAMITSFRQRICSELGLIPYVHQAAWFAASDGAVLLDVQDPAGTAVRLPDKSVEQRALAPRPGGRARVIADLGAYKVGKSWSTGLFAASFAIVPGARVQLVGLEYDICAPEFDYIVEFLLSGQGLGMKYDSLQNRPRDGKMWLDLANGARFEAKSWERKDTLKGKEVDLIAYCEAYMLPGLECYTSFSQNLRARDGYVVFATTPDRPWVKELHDHAHSGDSTYSKWHCTCGVESSANPETFDPVMMERDKNLMTREKFQIHYLGQLGDFVGRVYGYQRGQGTFSPVSHPQLFRPGSTGTHEDLVVPAGWELVGGADTGTFSSALLVLFSPDGDAFVLEEFPNYRYVAGTAELASMTSIPGWANNVVRRTMQLGGRPLYWADANGQFKKELQNYSMTLLPNKAPVEARSEIAREYFDHKRIFLAPWLSVLPFELENAAWPEEASASGKFARVKDRDHTLDCLEHILSKRPRGGLVGAPKGTGRWLDQWAAQNGAKKSRGGNPHLGVE